MSLRIVAGTASRTLGNAIAVELGRELAASQVESFPDGMRDDDVYVVQSTGPPVSDHLVELLFLVDACRRAGAGRRTAVVPYLGYARQDRRSRPGQAVATRVIADAIVVAGTDRLILVDPHTTALEAMCAIPVETFTAVPVLADALAPLVPADAIVAAPDLGAVKLAEAYASVLRWPVAGGRRAKDPGQRCGGARRRARG